MAHDLLRLLCLEFKVVDYKYFMDEMELWEAYILCENLQYCDRSVWEASRIISYISAMPNSKKKLKLTDIIKFPWDKTTSVKESREERIKKMESFLQRLNNGKRT